MNHINLQTIPQKSGIYQFKNKQDRLLYIGKAKHLKNRIHSYFHKSSQLSPHKQLMVRDIAKVEFIITSSETEALLLESSLIKKHQPPFNIDLKDDKNFQYIKITTFEDFPRVFTVRRILNDQAKYFGPFVSGVSVRRTLKLLRKLFPHRNFPKPVSQHYLELMLKRYPQLFGPADKIEYQKTIKRIINFLKGNYENINKDLKVKMKSASKRRQYEQAATYRDIIRSIKKITEKQIVFSSRPVNQDIISLARDKNLTAINLFVVRLGKLTNKQNFILKNTHDKTDSEIIQTFIERYYTQATNSPREIIIPCPISLQDIIEKTFKTKIIIPQRGNKRKYLALGRENATTYLEQQRASFERDVIKVRQALSDLQKKLNLPDRPRRIETYDISNIQGVNAVGSMVVFTNGRPDKQCYRKFKIKTVEGADDPAMMAEVLARRFGHHQPHPSSSTGRKTIMKKWPKPDLIILDGGKGQLSAALPIIPADIPIIALAKQEEKLYYPGKKQPVRLPANSEALYLLQRMRDEAHRFAITFYRHRHRASSAASSLDTIPGVGPQTKKKLLRIFGSINGLRSAASTELQKIVGDKLAATIREYL